MIKYRCLIALIGISLLFTACSPAGKPAVATAEAVPTVKADNAIIAEGRLEPIRCADIAFTASGVIGNVMVKEGETVEKGQPLIQLGNETDTNFASAQLEVANAQKALSDLKSSAGTDLAQSVIDLKDAREEYDKAVDYLKYLQNSKKVPQSETRLFLETKRNTWMYVYKTKTFRGPAPEDWIIEATNDLALKKAQLEAAQRTHDRLKDGVDTEQFAVLEARLHAAQAQFASLSVLAPFDGVLADMKAKPGSSINAGEIAVTVADFSQWLVKTTDLTEIDVVSLAEGQPVLVTLDAIPDEQLRGKIQSIGQTYSEIQGDIVYEVVVLITDVHPAMRWGMTAVVNFENQD